MQCSQEIASYCAGGPRSGANGDGGTMGSGDCAPSGGTTNKYVFDKILLPQQQSDYAYDLTGSGHPVNQYAKVIGSLSQQNEQPQAGSDDGIQSGQDVVLLSESSSDLYRQNDSCAAATVVLGNSTNYPPTKGYPYTAMGNGSTFAGPIMNATFNSAPPAKTKMPIPLVLPLPFVVGIPVKVPIVAAHLQFTYVNGLIMAGQINGAIKQSDINSVVTALAQALASKIAMDQASGFLSSLDMSLLAIFDNGGTPGPMQSGCSKACTTTCQNPSTDAMNACGCAVAGDKKLDECEVTTNSSIKSAYVPDVQLFDANGNYAPNPNGTHKDSMSIGVGFTATHASF